MNKCFGDIHFTVHSPPNAAIIGSSPHNSNTFPSSARPSHLTKETRQEHPFPSLALHPLPERKKKNTNQKHPWPWSCPATKSPDSAAYSEIVAQFFPGCTAGCCSLPAVTSIAPTHSFFPFSRLSSSSSFPGSQPSTEHNLHQTSIIYRSASEIDPSVNQLPNPTGSSDLIVLFRP